MKTFLKILLLILSLSLFVSCSDATSSDTVTNTAESTAAPSDEATENTEKPEETGGVGGTQLCKIHDDFHAFPSELIDYIGEERFIEWAESAEYVATDLECAYPDCTLYTCIKEFNIPRKDLEELYYGSGGIYISYVWNIPLLYSDDEKAVDDYFRGTERLHIATSKKRNFSQFKAKIIADNLEKCEDQYNTTVVTTGVSLHELVSSLDINLEMLRSYDISTDKQIEAGLVYDYDYSAIYNEDGSIKPLDESLSGIEQDALFCGIDDIYLE